MKYIENIIKNIKKLKVTSKDMKSYINSLNKEEYASLSTVFIIGRSGLERNYADTNEYYSFIEEKKAFGITVNQKMLNDKFLTNRLKKRQVQLTYEHELSSSSKINGIYNYNWLGMKQNLILEIEKGLNMLRELNFLDNRRL